MEKTAVITGACGGIGTEITRAIATAGYRVIMVCRNKEKAGTIKDMLIRDTGNSAIDMVDMNLSSLQSVRNCADRIKATYGMIDLLMNNAGTIATGFEQTADGFEQTVQTNYVGHYLFTRLLIPNMQAGSRIVNMVSCTYPLGSIDLPEFFTHGRKGSFFRLSVYSNTKLALVLFTHDLSERLKEKGIYVNAADPGIVSTNMVTMHQWFDPLADLFFRPFIRKPAKGAAGCIRLLLDQEYNQHTGCICTLNKIKKIPQKYINSTQSTTLWNETERLIKPFL